MIEDSVADPMPGLLVESKYRVQRHVTFARDGEICYTEIITLNGKRHERSGRCLLTTWRAWCRKNAAAEVLPF